MNLAPLHHYPVATFPRRVLRVSRTHLPALLESWHLRFTLANLVCAPLPHYMSGLLRTRVYRLVGLDVDRTASIMGNLTLLSGLDGFYGKLHIGPGSIVGHHVTINLDEQVRLGRNVSVSPHVLIYTGSHQIGPASNRKLHAVVATPVVLEDGCWIGLGAIILPGVTVGRGGIVGAGAVVTQDVPPNTYVEGNPARVVRKLPWGNR